MSTIGQISQCSTGDDMREDWIKNIYDTEIGCGAVEEGIRCSFLQPMMNCKAGFL